MGVAGKNTTRVESVRAGASVDVNAAVAANVDAAVATTVGLRLMGWSARESNGTPAVATFQIVHGITGAGGTGLVHVELAANVSAQAWYGPNGIACATGLSINHAAGIVDVNLFYAAFE